MSSRRTALAALSLGVLGSQAGHLLAYQTRYGAAAQQLQSTGAHAYFPLLAKTAIGSAAAALLAGLLVVGLARMLTGRPGSRLRSGPSYIGLFAALFTLQLAIFVAQELSEAAIAGVSAASVAQLLLWGTLGQLPVAAVGALALRWLGQRVETAVAALRDVLAAERIHPEALAPALPAWASPALSLLLAPAAGRSLARRGPPTSLRLSAI